jgi:CubicO group peptidase (beta-lactamase class C family)
MNSIPGRFKIALLAFGLLPLSTATGQELASAESVGMSPDRLERITVEAENQVKKGNLAGIVWLVARRGKIVHLEAVGHQHREENVPMKTDTICRIASMTKPITSLATLMLYEEGKFQLTDPLSTYIPEFKNMKVWTPEGLVDAEREITIYDLLTHNSGLAYAGNHEFVGRMYREAGIAGGGGLAPDEDPIGKDVRALAQIPLVSQPGAGFQYGHSTDVLGYLVEVVSGQSLAEFLEQRFFTPLKMKDTKFFLEDADVPRLGQLYIRDEAGKLIPEYREQNVIDGTPYGGRTPFDGPRVSYAGGGGLCSTCEDYFRFCQMVLQNGQYGGKRFVSRKTIEQATLPHLPMSKGFFTSESSDFGLGFGVQRDTGTPRPGSPGTLRWGSIFNGFFFIDPEEEIIGITLGQLFPGEEEWAERFMQLVYAAVSD